MKKKKQQTLFDDSEISQWKKEWEGMPEFVQKDAKPFRTINMYFTNQKAVDKFEKLIGQNVTEKTKYIWFPKLKDMTKRVIGQLSHKEYIDES